LLLVPVFLKILLLVLLFHITILIPIDSGQLNRLGSIKSTRFNRIDSIKSARSKTQSSCFKVTMQELTKQTFIGGNDGFFAIFGTIWTQYRS